jgi:hypothetical protein
MPEEINQAKGLLTAFSFVATLFSYFVTGFLFLYVTLPTVGARYFHGVIATIPAFWADLLKESRPSIILVYFLFAFLVGFTNQPLATRLVYVSGIVLSKCGIWLKPNELFNTAGGGKHYARLVDWLHERPTSKSAWEWEFFQYYLACGICLNLFVTSVILLCFGQLWWAVGMFAAWVYSLLHAWERSKVQRKMHDYYLDENK